LFPQNEGGILPEDGKIGNEIILEAAPPPPRWFFDEEFGMA
jgi:hypothetical protein